MTGYGRGACVQDGLKVTVELSSVNRKQAEVAVTLPHELVFLEAPIRELIHRHIARGRVVVRVGIHATAGRAAARAHLNVSLARAYAAELRRLARQLRLPGPVTLDHLVRAPGVFQSDAELAESGDCWTAVERAMRQAIAELQRMRAREGAHLARALAKHITLMRRSVERIRRRAPQVQANYRRQLQQRIQQAGLPAPAADDERLLKEVIYFADRSDITEELTRLHSHFQQFEDCLRWSEPVGRLLDFLAQEMNREINTIGAKANDSRISREVVTLKAELEKFREQAQNVE